MAITPTVIGDQGRVMAGLRVSSPSVHADQGRVMSTLGFPTPSMRADQGTVQSAITGEFDIRADQAQVFALGLGRNKNFYLRAWTFTMDGHDFYVLHLGEDGTLVYDCLTQQWMTWESEHRDTLAWKAATGCQWYSVQNAVGNSDAICGDDTTGMLYWLNPRQLYDSSNGIDPTITQEDFERVLTGGIPARGRGNIACNYVFLTGSLGNPYPGAQVLLSTSDDLGKTWTDNGYITVNPADWSQDVSWLSLGSFGTPGRLFQVSDNGAFERIDSLDMK